MTEQDYQQIKVLSILHYVAGGLMVLGSLLPLLYVGIGAVMLQMPERFQTPQNQAPVQFAWMFVIGGGLLALLAWFASICLFVGGRRLSRLRSYRICLFVAGVACACLPIVTVLGIFSFLVLLRPTVKQGFADAAVDVGVR